MKSSKGGTASGVDEEIVDRVRQAYKEGRLTVGVLDIVATSEEDLADLAVEAKLYGSAPQRGIPVVVRVQPETLEWLRAEADRTGVRGWRKLLAERVEAMAKKSTA